MKIGREFWNIMKGKVSILFRQASMRWIDFERLDEWNLENQYAKE